MTKEQEFIRSRIQDIVAQMHTRMSNFQMENGLLYNDNFYDENIECLVTAISAFTAFLVFNNMADEKMLLDNVSISMAKAYKRSMRFYEKLERSKVKP